MENAVYFKLPPDPHTRVNVLQIIHAATHDNYWDDCSGELLAPNGYPGVVQETGYTFSREQIPQICGKRENNMEKEFDFISMLKGGLPEFVKFSDLSNFSTLHEKPKGEKVSLAQGVEILSHYVGLGYEGCIQFRESGDFTCGIMLQEWQLTQLGSEGYYYYEPFQNMYPGNEEYELAGLVYPPRIVVHWRNKRNWSSHNRIITLPIIAALRKFGLEEYVPQPVSA